MNSLVEFTEQTHDDKPGAKVMLNPGHIVAVRATTYGDGLGNEPNYVAPPCVSIWTVAPLGSTSGFWPLRFFVRESYEEVRAKLLGAPRDMLDIMGGAGLDWYAAFFYGLERTAAETDSDYRQRCRDKSRSQGPMT